MTRRGSTTHENISRSTHRNVVDTVISSRLFRASMAFRIQRQLALPPEHSLEPLHALHRYPPPIRHVERIM